MITYVYKLKKMAEKKYKGDIIHSALHFEGLSL